MTWLRDHLGPTAIAAIVLVHAPPRRCAACRRLARHGERTCTRHAPAEARP